MFDWWLVRWADKTGKLTVPEWVSLLREGERFTITSGATSTWNAPQGGVIIVSDGAVRLSIYGNQSQHLIKLESGDMTGTLQASHCVLQALYPVTVHCFSHQHWLATLTKMPAITQKLLNGLASSALRMEQTLSESA